MNSKSTEATGKRSQVYTMPLSLCDSLILLALTVIIILNNRQPPTPSGLPHLTVALRVSCGPVCLGHSYFGMSLFLFQGSRRKQRWLLGAFLD